MEFIITAHQANLFNFSYHTKGFVRQRRERIRAAAVKQKSLRSEIELFKTTLDYKVDELVYRFYDISGILHFLNLTGR